MNQHPARALPSLQLCSCKWLSWYNIRLSGRKPTDTPGSPAVCHPLSSSQSTVSQRELRTPVCPSAVTKLKEQLQHNDKAYSFVVAFNPHCCANSGVGVFPPKNLSWLKKTKTNTIIKLLLSHTEMKHICAKRLRKAGQKIFGGIWNKTKKTINFVYSQNFQRMTHLAKNVSATFYEFHHNCSLVHA